MSDTELDEIRYKEMALLQRNIHVLLANEALLSLDESYRLSRKIFEMFMNSNIPDGCYLKTYKGEKLTE